MSPRLDPRPWISLKRNSFNFTFKNLFFLVVFLPIRLLLACDKDYVIPGHALVNHVSASFVGVTNYQDCVERCTANSACYSINYYNTGRCELNNATHLSHPMELLPSFSNVKYTISRARSLITCSNQYCSDKDICIVNSDGSSYQCKVCSAALGMESKAITNAQITASSQFGDPGHDPWKA
ncbi:uncharacterized protein LOC114574395 [Exaiptasia diaphana]|uniref:Apple domain-containing protein n=1 Tax=Exaiptasia diaphana TaxID=2652724 RepID=A0A913YC97_EXADI|nr:uncharacterized protein LOC114574395 [Exaiptasia diaphana]